MGDYNVTVKSKNASLLELPHIRMPDIEEIIRNKKQSDNSCLLITDPDRSTQRQIAKRAWENDCIAVCSDVFGVQNTYGGRPML